MMGKSKRGENTVDSPEWEKWQNRDVFVLLTKFVILSVWHLSSKL